MFAICTEELAEINISTVPNKTHMLINISDRCNLPSDLHSEIQVHTDGIRLLGTSIGDDEFLQTFLEATESSGFTFEGLQTPIPKLQISDIKAVHQLKTQTPPALTTSL